MERYEEKIISKQDLFKFNSFLIIEGQLGLPYMIEEVYNFLNSHQVWILQEVFEYKERIKAIPFLNPDVIIFQTTGMFYENISYIINYLIEKGYKPKEIWQIKSDDCPIVDSDVYEVFSIDYVDKNGINLTKI